MDEVIRSGPITQARRFHRLVIGSRFGPVTGGGEKGIR
jgi:hypothetical protein